MTLSNAIAIIRRQDAQVKVEVPATANRKAYSYMRETSVSLRTPKSSNRKMIGGAIAGAVGVGALTAGILALRRSKKNNNEPESLITSTPNNQRKMLSGGSSDDISIDKSLNGSTPLGINTGAQRIAIPASNEIDADSREVSNGIAGTSPKLLKSSNFIDVESREVSNSIVGSSIRGALPASNQTESSTAITEKKKGILSRGVDAIKKMTAEGIERDRKAGGAFADREIDLNKAAYSAGEKSRIAAQNLAAFANASVEVLGKKQPKSVDVKATEVKEELPEGKPMKKEPKAPKPKKAKTPKVPKLKSPTAAEKRAVQQKLNDLNK